MPDRVLVTGATGYVGGRLVPHLLAANVEVSCLVRNSHRLDRPFAGDVAVHEGSVDDVEAVRRAAEGCRVAYFLVHSLDSKGFEERDRDLAEGFRRGCEAAGVQTIIYLSGLGVDGDDLSAHLRSRHEVGSTLAAGSVAVIELRAAVIIGSGSASFEMLRCLTEVLPVMITPKWVNHTRCQPVAIGDVLEALLRAMPPEAYYVDADAARDAMRRRSMFNVVDLASGWKVDFIFRKDRAFSREEFARRAQLSLLGVPVYAATAEDTVIAKVEWSHQCGGSERQRRDVAGVLATMGDQLDRPYVERWVHALGLEEEWSHAQKTAP